MANIIFLTLMAFGFFIFSGVFVAILQLVQKLVTRKPFNKRNFLKWTLILTAVQTGYHVFKHFGNYIGGDPVMRHYLRGGKDSLLK
jgi:hypothetical protein